MNLKLNRPLCTFDLETTGLKIGTDRIVEISILKVSPNGSRESKTWLVNPEMPIPKEASDIHHITDEVVRDAPILKEIASEIIAMLDGSDLAGFNSNRFDLPLLADELLRIGAYFDFRKMKIVDAKNIYHQKEPRDLSAAYQFYCGKTLENAHSAEADTLATFEILDAQIGKYSDIGNTIDEIQAFSSQQKFADFAGYIGYNENKEEVFNFGKHKGKLVKEVLQTDLGYYSWIQNSEFPRYTKKVLTDIQLQTKFS